MVPSDLIQEITPTVSCESAKLELGAKGAGNLLLRVTSVIPPPELPAIN